MERLTNKTDSKLLMTMKKKYLKPMLKIKSKLVMQLLN